MTKSSPPSSVPSALENPLWEFSLDFYAHGDVEAFLLACQEERGADVCLLLWASYVTAAGRQLSEESWRVADRGLAPRRRIIATVRNLRRFLGGMRPRTQLLYERCKRFELGLEQRQLAALWKLQQESWPEDRSALALAGQQYGLPQKEQARWAGLIDSYCNERG
ncbi:TIGR02444 family protein [Microbulbifer yueqingensis]|uniref:TIGR02444 family protein n=1 Tax=Microbulbifer yueqingensis TaxID=658219 RepID=A0A1G9BHT2_9GAMM|nr:TIGR02444 family protein [Microbulbifer yueqingensis]SDK39062.1 TIGR02444 family protein [Microbulbifer yueqingensis]